MIWHPFLATVGIKHTHGTWTYMQDKTSLQKLTNKFEKDNWLDFYFRKIIPVIEWIRRDDSYNREESMG